MVRHSIIVKLSQLSKKSPTDKEKVELHFLGGTNLQMRRCMTCADLCSQAWRKMPCREQYVHLVYDERLAAEMASMLVSFQIY